MAFETGTATNFADLYNKLRDFLTTNVDLVADGQEWTQISGEVGTLDASDEIVLQGPGLAGADEVIVGIKPYTDVGADYYNLSFSGFTIWNPAVAYLSQVNSSHYYMLNLWNGSMDYWFVANGRRFIVVVRVSTVYMSAYCGLALPYVLPNLWPYPLFMGGSSRTTTWRYSQSSANMSAFFDPGDTTAGLLFPDVVWRDVKNRTDNSSGVYGAASTGVNTHPFRFDSDAIRENLDGSYNLEQVSVVCSDPYDAQLCALEGVYRVSGFSNNSENIITHGGVDHLVVQNVMRTTWDDFAAIALE